MYFDAVVVEVKTCLLLFRLALAILCCSLSRESGLSKLFKNFKNKGLLLKFNETDISETIVIINCAADAYAPIFWLEIIEIKNDLIGDEKKIEFLN